MAIDVSKFKLKVHNINMTSFWKLRFLGADQNTWKGLISRAFWNLSPCSLSYSGTWDPSHHSYLKTSVKITWKRVQLWLCVSLLLLQCLPCVLRLVGLHFGPDSVQQPLPARFIFYLACNYFMFCNICQNLSGWKWILLKRRLSIKIWSRTRTLQYLLLFFHFPVSLESSCTEGFYGMHATLMDCACTGEEKVECQISLVL